MTVSIVSKKLW